MKGRRLFAVLILVPACGLRGDADADARTTTIDSRGEAHRDDGHQRISEKLPPGAVTLEEQMRGSGRLAPGGRAVYRLGEPEGQTRTVPARTRQVSAHARRKRSPGPPSQARGFLDMTVPRIRWRDAKVADAVGELVSMAAGGANTGTNGPASSGIRMECAEGVGDLRVTMAADDMCVADVLRAVGLSLGLRYRWRQEDSEDDAVTLVVMRKPDGT